MEMDLLALIQEPAMITRSKRKLEQAQGITRKFGMELSTNVLGATLKRSKSSSNTKSNPKAKSFVILSDAPENAIGKEITVDKPNTTTIFSELVKEAVYAIEVKKITISQDELGMNGAPEGELFDVTVLSDEELLSFSSIGATEIQDIFDEARGKTLSSKATWGDRYAFVEVIRSIVLHHAEFMQNKVSATIAIQSANNAVESLRSSEIRNGLLALKGILGKCQSFLDTSDMATSISLLMAKSAIGPKFICKQASEIIDVVFKAMSPTSGLHYLSSHVSHKFPEAAAKAITTIVDILLPRLQSENEEHSCLLSPLITSLNCGLSCKRATGSAAAKTGLIKLRHTIFTDEIFNNCVDSMDIESSKKQEILSISASAPKQCSSSNVLATSSFLARNPIRPFGSAQPIARQRPMAGGLGSSTTSDRVVESEKEVIIMSKSTSLVTVGHSESLNFSIAKKPLPFASFKEFRTSNTPITTPTISLSMKSGGGEVKVVQNTKEDGDMMI